MNLVLISLASMFAGALLLPLVLRPLPRAAAYITGIIPWCGFIALLMTVPLIQQGEVLTADFDWVPSLDLSLAFRLDGLSLVMGLLITGIGGFIMPYACGYMGEHRQARRLYGFLLLFMGAMLGLVLADDLVLLFIFWELTSISSYLLIGFNHEKESARKKALQALLVTGLGGIALLAAFVLMMQVTGASTISGMLAEGASLAGSEFYLPILILFLLGAFTKSAQVPFHFWLPNAMAAPTPISAFLHSATMVKAGIYIIARFSPQFSGPEIWNILLTLFGGATMITGAIMGMLQTDLKRILAYTTMSVLGILTLLLGQGTEIMYQAAIIFLLGHALYKAALFMVAGIIDHATGERDVQLLRGLRGILPWTAGAALLAALSKAGFPPFFGFLGKEYVYKGSLALPEWGAWILGLSILTNAILLSLAFKVGLHPFWGEPREALVREPRKVPLAMAIGPVALALMGLTLGVIPGVIEKPLIESAVSAIVGYPAELKVALWHGFNIPVLLSGMTLLAGVFIYRMRHGLWLALNRVRIENFKGAEYIYGWLLDKVLAFAGWQTKALQSGKLRNYLLIIIGTSMTLLAVKLFMVGGLPSAFPAFEPTVLECVLMLCMVAAVIGAVKARSRLTAILALGIIGFGIALIYVIYGAPDLAITQVLVETLIVVLFMFVVYRLPFFRTYSTRSTRIVDAFFSLGAGAVVTAMVMKAHHLQLESPISDLLAQASYLEAKGKNVVNVILVDFRALDTLGEITVLGIAALGVIALMRKESKEDKESAKS
jgi:multicomponent Na+:H+ antiporter subunit A